MKLRVCLFSLITHKINQSVNQDLSFLQHSAPLKFFRRISFLLLNKFCLDFQRLKYPYVSAAKSIQISHTVNPERRTSPAFQEQKCCCMIDIPQHL